VELITHSTSHTKSEPDLKQAQSKKIDTAIFSQTTRVQSTWNHWCLVCSRKNSINEIIVTARFTTEISFPSTPPLEKKSKTKFIRSGAFMSLSPLSEQTMGVT
jgi:hypothetical protein